MTLARMSRHWYDLYCLHQAGFASQAMEDRELFEAIRHHRKIFTKVSGVDYDTLSPTAFNLFPPEEHEIDWQRDYQKMMESYIYRDAPSLDILMESIHEIVEAFRKLNY